MFRRVLVANRGEVAVRVIRTLHECDVEAVAVYSTVDRRYYHVNVPGGEQYFEVNLQPGYQRLCGTESLQFVSYRHGDTSLVRDARDEE